MTTALLVVGGVLLALFVVGVTALVVLELVADDAQRSGRNWFR